MNNYVAVSYAMSEIECMVKLFIVMVNAVHMMLAETPCLHMGIETLRRLRPMIDTLSDSVVYKRYDNHKFVIYQRVS